MNTRRALRAATEHRRLARHGTGAPARRRRPARGRERVEVAPGARIMRGRAHDSRMDTLAVLLASLDLTPLDADRFEGRAVERARRRVFGGELLAQSIAAASRTASGRRCHALHAQFLLGGDPALPL